MNLASVLSDGSGQNRTPIVEVVVIIQRVVKVTADDPDRSIKNSVQKAFNKVGLFGDIDPAGIEVIDLSRLPDGKIVVRQGAGDWSKAEEFAP